MRRRIGAATWNVTCGGTVKTGRNPLDYRHVIITSMTLTLEEVEHIAILARLSLTEEEKNRYRDQLSAVLDYAARLQEIDTEGIPPTSSVLHSGKRLRKDESKPGLKIDELLENAPDVVNKQFRVPPVLDT